MTETATAPRRYKVTAPYVTVSTGKPVARPSGTRAGRTIVGLLRDSLLPEDATQTEVEHLLSVGLIEEVPNV